MAYSQTTLGQLTQALSNRLSDPGLFWTPSEQQSYIIEALRTWQAFSASYSTRINIPTTPNAFFYNLFELAPQLTPTITDRDIIVQLEQHLMEPINPVGWSGSEQFNYSQLVQSIQKRRDQFFLQTGLHLRESTIAGPSPGSGTVALDDKVIDVRRAMWIPTESQIFNILWRADPITLTGGNPSWLIDPDVPYDYSVYPELPVILQVSPPPSDNGSINLLTIDSGDNLDPADHATILGIPDDLSWVVKFGALADLFSVSGPGQDLSRAKYCESRWQDGIKLARITNYVKFGYLDGYPLFIDSIAELDMGNPDWVSTIATPEFLGTAGNIICVSPVADNQPHSMAMDITPNFPVPSTPNGFVQIGKEVLSVIVDYAEHLASIKEGAAEISDTSELYKNMIRLAATQNDRFRAIAQNFDVMSDRSLRHGKFIPRRVSDLDTKELNYVQDSQ